MILQISLQDLFKYLLEMDRNSGSDHFYSFVNSITCLKYFKHFHTLLVDIKLANFCCVFFDPANLLLGRST